MYENISFSHTVLSSAEKKDEVDGGDVPDVI